MTKGESIAFFIACFTISFAIFYVLGSPVVAVVAMAIVLGGFPILAALGRSHD